MPNDVLTMNEPIDPAKVVLDPVAAPEQPEAIDPAKVTLDPVFTPSNREWGRLREAFAGQPLAVFEDAGDRARLELETGRMDDPETFRKRYALAAYYSQMRKQDFPFTLSNLDAFISKYNDGKPQSVEAAYSDIAALLNPPKPGEGGALEVAKAGGAGLMKTLVNLGYSSVDMLPGYSILKHVNGIDKQVETMRGESAGYFADVAEKNTQKALDEEWFTRWNNGRWMTNAGKFLAIQAPSQAAQLTAAYYLGPVAFTGLMGASSGIDKYYDLEWNNPDMTENQRVINAALTGVVNSGAAWITAGIVKGKIPVLGKVQIKGETKAAIAYFLEATGIEAGQEAVEQLAENTADIYTGVHGDPEKLMPQQFKDYLWNGIGESALAGGAFGVGGAGVGFRSFRAQSRAGAEARNAVEGERERLLAVENPTDEDVGELDKINGVLDAGNINDIAGYARALAVKDAMEQEARADAEAEMTDEDTAAEAEQRLAARRFLPHNPADTADVAAELMQQFPGMKLRIYDNPDAVPEAVKRAAGETLLNPARMRAFVGPASLDAVFAGDESGDAVYLVASNVRPSDVAKTIGHEVIGHKGLRAVFGERFDNLLDMVYKDYYAEIGKLAESYTYDLETDAGRRNMTEEFLSDMADAKAKPKWWKEFLQKVKMGLRKLPLLRNLRFTDRELEAALLRSARAMRRMKAAQSSTRIGTDGVHFSIDGRYFRSWEETLEQFKSELDGVSLTDEQQGIYDVATGNAKSAEIRKSDIDELGKVYLHKGSRNQGARKIISIHYNGRRNPVTAWEIVNIGEVIRNGAMTEDGTSEHPNSRRYEMAAPDGANLRVVIDLDKKNKNESVINYYSDRKPETGGKKASPGSITDSENNINGSGEEINPETDGNQENADGIRFSVAPENENLIVVHNVSARKLRDAAKLGGMPVPSMAIVDAEVSDFTNFGEITLIADKNLIDPKVRGNKVYNADIYSPRAPSITKEYSASDYDRVLSILQPYDETEKNSYNNATETIQGFKRGTRDGDFEDSLHRLPAVRKWYSQTAKGNIDFESWWQDVALPEFNLHPDEKIFNGYTPSGRRKWIPATLDNVVKLMTKKVRNGEGFNYGIGNIRSMKAVQFKSIAQIQKARENIVSEEALKQVKEDIRSELDELADYMKTQNGDKFGWEYDTAEDCLLSMAEGGYENVKYLRERFGENRELFSKMARFLDKLRNLPTEYFEAKIQRAVDIGEFRAAVVPHDLPNDVRALLERAGVPVVEYNSNNQRARKEALQIATTDNDIRFSQSGFSEQDRRDIVTVLKPFVGMDFTRADSDYVAYLGGKGIEVNEAEAHMFAVLALRENEEAGKARRTKQRDDWLYENVPVWREVVDQLGPDFKIQPSQRFRGEEMSGTFLVRDPKKETGMNSDELAQAIARKDGRDALDVEQEIMDFFADLKKPDLFKIYHDWKRQTVLEDKALEERMKEEYEADRAANPEKYLEMDYNKMIEEVGQLRQRIEAEKADVLKLQREAAAFAETHLRPENRSEFTRKILKLLEYSTLPSKKYPLGRRMAEFRNIFDEIVNRQSEVRKGDSIAEIDEMLASAKIKRNYKGIPVSVIPSEQQTVDRIRQIRQMNLPALASLVAYNQEQLAALSEKGDDGATQSESDRLLADNLLAETFGNLANRPADAAAKAQKVLHDLITGAKLDFSMKLDARREEVNAMRKRAIDDATFGKNVVGNRDAAKHWEYTVGNSGMKTLLAISSGQSIEEFDSSIAGELYRKVEDSTQAEATALRTMQGDFDAALKSILGIDSMRKKGRFFKDLHESKERSGVYINQYSRPVRVGKDDFVFEEGRRQAVTKSIPVEDYEYQGRPQRGARSILAALDNGESIVSVRGVPLDGVAVAFLRQQLADFDAGLKQSYEVFSEANDDAALNRMIDEARGDGRVVLFSHNPEEQVQKIELPLSQGAALQLLLTWDQEHYRPNMIWNGWTEESIGQLEAFIKPEVRELGNWMRDYIARNKKKLDEKTFDRYGAHLPENPAYFPASFKGDRASSVDSAFGRGAGSMSINPAFLIARKFHLKPVDLDSDAVATFFGNQLEQSHFLAWADTMRDLKSVYGNAQVQKAIDNNFGRSVREGIVNRIDTIAKGGGERKGAVKLLNDLYRYWIPAKIAFNPSSVIKQVFGSAAYMNKIPPEAFVRGMAAANFGNPEFRSFVRWAKETDYFKNRMGGALDKDLIYLLNYTRDNKAYSPWADAMMHYGTMPTRLADAWSTLHGGYAVYRYHLEKAKRSGLSSSEAHDAAAREWMRSTDETQQSGYLKDLNEYQANQGAYRYLTAFLSNPIQVMNLQLQAINELRYGKDKAAAGKKLARLIVVNHFILPTLMQFTNDMLRNGLDFEEYEFEDYFVAWALGQFEAAFLFGKAASELGNLLLDKTLGRSIWGHSKFSALPLYDEIENSMNSIFKLADPGEMEAKDWAGAIQGLGAIGMGAGLADSRAGAAGMILNAIGTQAKRIIRFANGGNN